MLRSAFVSDIQLYIKNLIDLFPDEVVIKLYADDVKLYSNITTNMVNVKYDLQDHLSRMSISMATSYLIFKILCVNCRTRCPFLITKCNRCFCK